MPKKALTKILLSGLLACLAGWSQADEELRSYEYRGPSPNIETKDVADLERKLIEAFNANGCASSATVASPFQLNRLGPTALAVFAYCQKDPATAENLFHRAEAGDPTSDMTFLLHARYVWTRNHKRAEALWRKVLLYARSPETRMEAMRYLGGRGTGEEPIFIAYRWRYYVNAQPGIGAETNPFLQADSDPHRVSSGLLSVQTAAGAQRQFGVASFSANYTGSYSDYVAETGANLWQNTLELPVSLRVGTNEDIRLRPFGGYQSLGSSPLYGYGGFSVIGDTWRGDSRHLVQGSVYFDKFYQSDLAAQAGTHFRFDYTWEFYPPDRYFQLVTYVEHVQAGREVDAASFARLPYSHNDIALQGFAEYNLKWVILAAGLKLLVREDDNASTYVTAGLTSPIQKRRQDFQLTLTPSASFPLRANTFLILSYKWFQQFSNMGEQDYYDYNIGDHLILLSLRFSFTNF